MGFDPVTMLAAGTAISAFGQYQAGEEASAVSKYNQQVKQREADAADQRATIRSRKQAEAAAQKMGALRAQMGAAGADTSAGAPLEILSEQARQSTIENLEIGYEGTQESQRLREEGKMIRAQGRSARRASRIGAGATLLTGFGAAGMG
jgi:hypothetical protein